MILAALLIVISVVSLILMYKGNKKEIGGGFTPLSYFAFAAMVISLIFGILIFAFPAFFTGILVLLLLIAEVCILEAKNPLLKNVRLFRRKK